MSKIKTATKLFFNNNRAFLRALFDNLNHLGLLHWINDEAFLKIRYRLQFGEKLNINKPNLFNEKIQWLKLNDRNPDYCCFVDKVRVKEYISTIVGAQYVIPLLGTWNKPEDIDWDSLPNQFVIKWNHDSGSIVVCKDKRLFNKETAIQRLKFGKKNNGYWYGREWPYKGVKPILFAEQYMEDSRTNELRDYKVFTFNGKAKLFLVASDRQTKGEEVKFDYFDVNKRHLNITNNHPHAKKEPRLPNTFDVMIALAEKIAAGSYHMRVDFYEVDGKVYFGEITLYHGSGWMFFEPNEWNQIMGDWIVLPTDNK